MLVVIIFAIDKHFALADVGKMSVGNATVNRDGEFDFIHFWSVTLVNTI
jgi:hypothetical protein